MEPSIRSQVVASIYQTITELLQSAGVQVTLNSTVPDSAGTAGRVIVRDGEWAPGERLFVGSPERQFEQQAEVEVYVQIGDDATRTAKLETLNREIANAIETSAAIRSLVDEVECQPPFTRHLPVTGSAPLGTSSMFVVFRYVTANTQG